MRYIAFARLLEDVVCHCVTDDAFEIQLIKIYALGELFKRDFFVDFDGVRDFELIDGQQRQRIG
jgi:hypothetical protein